MIVVSPLHEDMKDMRSNIYTVLLSVWLDSNICKRKITVYFKPSKCFPLDLVIPHKGI